MDDDLRAELEKLIAWCRKAQVATEWQNMPTPQMVAAQVGDELAAILARHPEPAAPSETDLERADNWLGDYIGEYDPSQESWNKRAKSLAVEFAQVRSEHAKQVAAADEIIEATCAVCLAENKRLATLANIATAPTDRALRVGARQSADLAELIRGRLKGTYALAPSEREKLAEKIANHLAAANMLDCGVINAAHLIESVLSGEQAKEA